MGLRHSSLARVRDADVLGVDPPYDYPDYVGTRLRHPKEPLVLCLTLFRRGPGPSTASCRSVSSTTTSPASTQGEPMGERITVSGRVLGSDGRPIRGSADRGLAGERRRPLPPRGRHARRAARPELHRCRAVPDRRQRRVPLRHGEAWRVSVAEPSERLASGPHPLLGLRAGDPRSARHPDVLPRRSAFPFDPIFNSIRDERARERLVSTFELDLTEPEWSLGFRFDIVLGGRNATPLEEPHDD